MRSGEYDSPDDVIGDALRMLEAQSRLQGLDIDALRAAWRDGMASGDFAVVDIEEIRKEGRRLLNAGA